ncbi:protein SFI1 homolog isoform X6 [Halichoerus grypus]
MKNLLTEKCISGHCQISIKREVSRECRGRWTPDKSPEVELWIIWSFKDGAVKKTYPPKILANQKSSAFSGMRSEIPSASHPVQYHASRGWTQRNRLRELRIRCVARKFLYLWIRMTFGRVFPSKARFYYEQRILRKVFEEWKEEWWVFQREWKLCVRADCHYRYYLYNLMFQTWRTYVHQQQEMRTKYIKAENHDARQKMRQAWKSWLIYVVFRRTKLQMQTTALEFRQRSILWLWWSQWREQLGQVRVGHALLASAVKHRALSLQLQAWSRWWEQLLHVQRERWKMISAVKHHEHWQKWKSLKAWLKYLRVRRVKRQWNEMAERFHRVTMLQTHFCDWQWAWERKESLYAQHAQVEGLARRMALRRAFTHWKHYVLLYAEEVAQWKVAEEHRRRSLLHFCFRALKDNVTHAHLQQIRRNLAHQQYDITLLHRFWDLWQTRIEQREEREQLPSLCAAWDHCRITLLRKCIKSWLQYTQKRRYKQRLRSRADSHFEQRVLPAAFRTWRRFWRWHQQESVLSARAARFHRETLEKQVFAIWWQKMFQHRENRLAERMAILHSERQLLQRSWSTWHQQAAARHRERQWTAAAWAHHRHCQLRRAFCIWRDSARGLRTEKTGLVLAAEFHAARLLRQAWDRWKEGLALRAAERRKLTRARLHHRRTLLRGALRTWATYQSRVRSVLQEVAARERQHARRLLRCVFRRWRENTLARVTEAQQTSRASAHYRRTLCSKVLVQWREAASVQIYYRQQEDCAIKEARKVLDKAPAKAGCPAPGPDPQPGLLPPVETTAGEQEARAAGHSPGPVVLVLLTTGKGVGRVAGLCAGEEEKEGAAGAGRTGLPAAASPGGRHAPLALRGRHEGLPAAAACPAAGAAHSLHRAVHHCAMLWKQKVLGQGREPRPLTCTMPSRRVTFDRPLSTCVAAGAGDAALETKKPRDPHGPRGALGSLSLAAGDPHLLELNAARLARKQPRRPHFLLEPVPSQRPLGCGTLGGKGPEAPRACDPGVAQPAGPALTRPFLPVAWTALAPSSPLPQPGALPGHPGPKLPPTLSTGPELLPPSSFMPCGVQAPARASAQPTTPGLTAQASPSPAGVPHSRLLLPGDFTGTGGPGSASAGAQLKLVSTKGAWDPSIRPWPSRDRGRDPACSVTKGPTDLEAELEGIQQQLQDYRTMKQNLSSCQRQARSLRRWLELSHEEPRPEDQEAERQVQEELQEVERQIQQLASELQAQRQPVSACIARVQALRRALC